MIKLFKKVNGVFVAKGMIMMVLDHKGQEEQILVEFNEVEEFNFIKLVKNFEILSVEKINKLSNNIVNKFIGDINDKLGEDISDTTPATFPSEVKVQ